MSINKKGGFFIISLAFLLSAALPAGADYSKVDINGGEIHHIAVAPSNPDRIYAASRHVNLWRSNDGGMNWNETNLRGATNGGAEQVVVDPNNEAVILTHGGADGGLYRSDDSGANWNTITVINENEIGLMDIAFCPAQSGVVYFAGNNMSASPATGEVWKSYNSGETWEKTDFNSYENPLTSIAVDINGVIYVGYKEDNMEPYPSMDGYGAGGIWVSTDSAANWYKADYPDHTDPDKYFYPLSIKASSTTVAFGGGGNIWVSTGTGAEFNNIFEEDVETAYGMDWEKIRSFAITPDGTKIFYPFTHDGPHIFKTEYSGTWSTGTKHSTGDAEDNDLDENLMIYDVGIYIDPVNPDNMYLSDTFEHGVFKSNDGGVNWSISNDGINALIVQSGVKCAQSGNIYILGPSSIYRSTDDGTSWERVYGYKPEQESEASGFRRGDVTVNADGVIVAAGDRNLVRSDNVGENWSDEILVYPGDDFTPGGIVFNPDEPNIGYAAFHLSSSTEATSDKYLYKTVNAGQEWSAVTAFSTMSVHSIAMDPADPDVLYAGIGEHKGWIEDKDVSSIPGGILKITDKNPSGADPVLKIENIGLEETIPYKIVVDTVNPTIIYAAVIEDMEAPHNEGPLYVSRDGGEKWTRMYDDAIYDPWGGISDMKFSYPGVIYSNMGGVYTVMDVGLESETHKEIMPPEEVGWVRSLTLGSVYAGASTGLWEFIGSLYDIVSEPGDDEEDDIGDPLAPDTGNIQVRGGAGGYVNPTRGESARIYFKPAGVGKVRASVYTTKGQLVWEETKRVSGVGVDHFEWACRNVQNNVVASGIYIVHVKGPGLDKTERIAIVK